MGKAEDTIRKKSEEYGKRNKTVQLKIFNADIHSDFADAERNGDVHSLNFTGDGLAPLQIKEILDLVKACLKSDHICGEINFIERIEI